MTPPPASPLARLLAGPIRPGQLTWIGLRSQRKGAIVTPKSAVLIAGRGIDGDHYETRRDGPRQVTLIGIEDLQAIASYMGRTEVSAALLRRNLVTAGVNLLALKGRRFKIGGTVLEASGECAPCSRMEEALGPGGYNAVRGHGGITARVIQGGEIHLSDVVQRDDEATE